MLIAEPEHFWTWEFDLSDTSGRMASLDMRWASGAAEVRLRGQTYCLGREKLLAGSFYLEQHGERIASAHKPSVFQRRIDLRLASGHYRLRPESMFARSFTLERDGTTVGRIRRTSFFHRRAEADLPGDLPPEVQVFIVWLVLLLWRRAARRC